MKLQAIIYFALINLFTVAVSLSQTSLRAQSDHNIRLTNVLDQSGIDFVHTDGGTGRRYIVESVVAGLATFDYDGDGYVDIFFANGKTLENVSTNSSRSSITAEKCSALYRNNGDFTFTDVTQQAGLAKPCYGMGAVAADYDEDGDVDLYVSNFGKNYLYSNNGDGTFTENADSVGLNLPDKVGAGCVFVDIENDGDLDLYVGSYVQFSLDKHVDHFIGKNQFHPGPTNYPPSVDALFQNQGDGTFVDVSSSSGVASQSTYSMGVIAFDADEDGDTDIWVANDQRANTLWINNGNGVFEDQAAIAGVAFDRYGKANGNMGVEIGDVNQDGLMDLFTTTYQDEMPVLYENLGGGQFIDQTNVFQIDSRLKPHVTWGCGLVDFDNDGDLDLYIACGHFMDNIQFIDDRTTVKVRDFVLENRNGKFVDVSTTAGSGLEVVESSRGAAFDDLDNDGDIDVIILNFNARPAIMRNDQPEQARRQGLNIELIGTKSNRGAIGAKLNVEGGHQRQIRQVLAGRGYQSGYSHRLHIVTLEQPIVSVEVHWPSGIRESFRLSDSERTWTLIEGTGVSQ